MYIQETTGAKWLETKHIKVQSLMSVADFMDVANVDIPFRRGHGFDAGLLPKRQPAFGKFQQRLARDILAAVSETECDAFVFGRTFKNSNRTGALHITT